MRKEHGIRVHGIYSDGDSCFSCTACGGSVKFLLFDGKSTYKLTHNEAHTKAVAAYCERCKALITNARFVRVTRRHVWIRP